MNKLEGEYNNLTNPPPTPYSKGGGNLMAENGAGENLMKEPSGSTEKLQSPLTRSSESIQNLTLKQHIVGFEQKMQQKPISEWSVKELKDVYLNSNKLVSQLGIAAEFGEKEKLASDIQPLNQLVMEELERKGVDLKELFLENQEKLRKEGLPRESIGAATAGGAGKDYINKAGITDPLILAEIDVINNLVDIDECGKSVLIEAFERVSRLTGVNDIEKKVAIEEIKRKLSGIKKTDIQEIQKEKENSEERKNLVMDSLEKMTPHTNPLPIELVELVIEEEDNLDYLVNRIVAQPLDAEQSEYRLSFYGGINLDQIKDILKAKSGGNDDKAQKARNNYKRVLFTSESAQLFHTMNLQIITGNLEQFVNGARAITPEQLQMMQSIPGVAQIMRLFDAELFRILGRDGIINNKNYNEIMGLTRDEKGKIIEEKGGGTIEQRFNKIKDKVSELQGLKEWQLRWAFNVGKIMGNLSLRAAEQISLSQYPRDPKEQFASIPQESAARLMNWVGWTGLRFEMAKVRGGVLLTRMASKIYQKDREVQGFGRMGGKDFKIKKLGWQDIEDFELAGMFGVTGVWSSWRQNLIVLDHAPTSENNKDSVPKSVPKTIGDLLGEATKFKSKGNPKGELIKEEDRIKQLGFKGRRLEETLQRERAERLKEVFLENGELKNTAFNNALGLILKHGNISVSEKDLETLRKAKEDVRVAIWRRVAEDNPLAIIPYLQGTQLVGSTEEIGLEGFGTKDWDGFVEKLSVLHEMRMQILKDGRYISLKDVIESEKRKGSLEWGKEDEGMLKDIEIKGKDRAIDLANVRFPNNPFMNDVVFEKADYSDAGAEFYRRRAGGDLSSYYAAGTEFAKLMMNPGGTTPEEAFKVLLAVTDAIGSPNGTDAGQDKVAPFLQAYLTFISKGESMYGIDRNGKNIGNIKENPGLTIWRWIMKDNAISGAKSLFRQPTSLAQTIAGLNAPSLDEFQMRALMEELLKMGITRKGRLDENGMVQYTNIDKRLRKRIKAGLLHWLLAIMRDLSKVALVGVASEFMKDSTKENK